MADIVTKAEFRRYMQLQRSGRYNMTSPCAFRRAHMSLEKYEYILNNYDDLERQFGTFENEVPNAGRVTA